MAIRFFQTPSRSYDATRRAVRFWATTNRWKFRSSSRRLPSRRCAKAIVAGEESVDDLRFTSRPDNAAPRKCSGRAAAKAPMRWVPVISNVGDVPKHRTDAADACALPCERIPERSRRISQRGACRAMP